MQDDGPAAKPPPRRGPSSPDSGSQCLLKADGPCCLEGLLGAEPGPPVLYVEAPTPAPLGLAVFGDRPFKR